MHGSQASLVDVYTFQVVADEVASEPTDVTSVVIQRPVPLSVCFYVFLDPLMQTVSKLAGPVNYAFANDFEFVTGTSPREHRQAQSVVNFVNGWSKDHRMPLSLIINAVFCTAAVIDLV